MAIQFGGGLWYLPSMLVYKPPIDDIMFLLETFGYSEVLALEGFSDFDLTTSRAICDEIAKFCVNELLPLNGPADQEGLGFDPKTGAVTTPKGFKEAWAKLTESGLMSLSHPAEYGGMSAPQMLSFLAGEMITACNKSFSMCPGLSHGLIESLIHYGSDEQKATYLEKLITGEWTGTMCLTEPQCGTDLGLIRTKAVPDGDAFKLTGTKIWITFGEHDLSDNIIHLVLARLPDAPRGIRGISAFVVPKVMPDGTLNGVKCTGLEHKLGIVASPTCVMSLEDATGYLVGEPHKGMRSMFVMMNSARLAVGIEGYALAEIAYQTAVAFAKERRQMRALDPAKRSADHLADVILVHPDVRRMLLNQRATNEGMRALGAYCAQKLDISKHHPDPKVREEADDLVALLTPIVKSYCTERGFLNISDAMQVTGGAGFTRDFPIEQYMRDERIAMIYEGTNHIQALDLVARKLPLKGGRLVRRFATEVTGALRAIKDEPRLADFAEGLKEASKLLTSLTMALAQKGMADAEEAGAVASNYLNVFGLTAVALMWTRMATVSLDRDGRFYETKLKVGRFFIHNVLPEIHSLAAVIGAGKQHMMALEADEF